MLNDFIVIGAGAVGLSTAQTLLQAGAQVTVLERGDSGKEASWAGGGIMSPLCPWDYPDDVTRLALLGMARFESFTSELTANTGVDTEYQRCGMRVLPPFNAKEAANWCEAHGMRYEFAGDAIFLPEIAQVRNPRLLRAMRERVLQLGGRIVEQCEVLAVEAQAGRVRYVRTSCWASMRSNWISNPSAGRCCCLSSMRRRCRISCCSAICTSFPARMVIC